MASLSSIRQQVAAALTELGTPWAESPLHPQAFARSPDSVKHGAFAVDLPIGTNTESRPRAQLAQRESLTVQFWARVVPAKQGDSFDTALDLEVSARNALLATTGAASHHFHVTYQTSTRELQPAGDFQLVTLNCTVHHFSSVT